MEQRNTRADLHPHCALWSQTS